MFSKKVDCMRCKSAIKADFDFCPHCGCDMRNPEKDLEEFGLLGKDESSMTPLTNNAMGGLGFSDKLISSLFNQIMKSLESQMGAQTSDARMLPNGIQVKIGVPVQKQAPRLKIRKLSDDQMKRMAGVPRIEAKSDIRRLSDRVVYDLKAPGVTSLEDVFVSKVESGYEVKAIAKNKVFVNSLQVDLPLKGYTLHEKGITFEFGTQ